MKGNNTILTMMKKELARFFGDRRMVMTTVLLPGLMIFVMYHFMGDAMSSQFEVENFKPKCQVVNVPQEMEPTLKKSGFQLKTVHSKQDQEKAKDLIREKELDLLIVFPENFTATAEEYEIASGKEAPEIQVYYNSADTESDNAFTVLTDLFDQYESSMTNKFDVNRGEGGYDMATKEDTAGMVFSSMLPFLLLIFLYSGCIAVAPEAIAGEKERGTIASLLITPAKRSHIALGKIAALSIITLLSGASSALGTILSLPELMGQQGEKLNGAVYTVSDYLLLSVVIMSTVLVLVTLISIISAFARTIKEAQTYVTPLMIVVMLVGITAMFGGGAKDAIYYYMIPIYNSVQSMIGIFSFEVVPSNILVTAVSNLVVTGVGITVLAKMFNSEYVMFHK